MKSALLLLTALLLHAQAGAFWARSPERRNPYDGKATVPHLPSGPAATPTPCPAYCGTCVRFEDYETLSAPAGGYAYNDGQSSSSVSISGAEAHSCGQSLAISFNTAASTAWGAGGGSGSHFGASIDASTANYLRFWVKAAVATAFTVHSTEENGSAPLNETWNSPTQHYSTPGAWQEFAVPLPWFSEALDNANCSPNCASLGDNSMDKGVLSTFALQVPAGVNTTVYVDDVAFDPAPLPVPHGALVDDFDAGSTDVAARSNRWYGPTEIQVDSFGSSTVTAGLSSPGHDGSGRALSYSGVLGKPVSTTPYPYNALRLYLAPQAKAASDDALAAGSAGLRFWGRSGGGGAAVYVKLILKALSDYSEANPSAANAYHYHLSSANLTSTWTQFSLPYSTFLWGGSWGADSIGPTYNLSSLADAVCRPGGQLQVMAIQFEPVTGGSPPFTPAAFDFSLDQIEFY